MRKSSVLPPPGAYLIEDIPGEPNKVLIKLYERAEMVFEKVYWVYDEYCIEVEKTDTLQYDILNDYDSLMRRAKEHEVNGGSVDNDALLVRLDSIRFDNRYMLLPEWVKERLEHILD